MGTFSGPGTIFLMVVGACVAAFGFSNYHSFIINLIPIVIYIFVCMKATSKWQLILSEWMSYGYALLMAAVIVGTALQLYEDGSWSPSSLFLIFMTGSLFIAACLHLQEFW